MRHKYTGWILVTSLVILINLGRFFPETVENYYSTGLYTFISYLLRLLFGWLPFSIGDVFYASTFVIIIIKIIVVIKQKIQKIITWRAAGIKALSFFKFLLWVYVFFYFLWGMNYYRQGITKQLGLKPAYTQNDVETLLDDIIIKLNENRLLVSKDTLMPQLKFKQITGGVQASYDEAAKKFPFLEYNFSSIKKSMYSGVAQYMGFTGYYNPFTGEAQARSVLPNVLQPYILCHEAAHQLGYGSEDEANFTGYIAATASKDPYFRYSAYLDLYGIVRGKLLFIMLDSMNKNKPADDIFVAYKNYNIKLDTLVRFDRRKIREYYNGVQSSLSNNTSNAVMNMYDKYLKANNQRAGVNSYSDVTGWLIAYKKKYGKI